MEPVWQSLLVLSKEWPSILGMLGIFFLGGAALSFGLKAIFKDSLTFGEYFTLGAGGALLSLMLGALLVRLLNLISGVQIGFIWGWIFIFLIAILLAFRTTGWRIHWTAPNLASTSLALLFICSAFIRLAFIWDLQVPLYFDSAMHYSIITDLMKTLQGLGMPDFQSFVGGYYHLGFHILAAAFSLVLKLPAPNVMLLFGQIVLALLPLPLFFIIRQETKLDAPGIFAVLLASVGWYMPAHMLDWGKYPALTSLLSFEFSLCCLLLLREAPRRLRWALVGLVVVSILFSTFIHSRSLVLIGMALASGLIASGWRKLSGRLAKLLPALSVLGLLLVAFAIQSSSVLRLAFDPYLGNQGWMTLVILVLLPTAFKAFPRAAFASLLFTFFLIGSLLISVTRFFPIYDAQTLLDRPFVEGALFLPLAILGGLGYAGLLELLKSSGAWQATRKNKISALMAVCLFGTILIQLPRYNFFPSNCCKLFAEQDAAAFEWLDRNTPAKATILIASFETVVFDSNLPAGFSGADAGIWITPFTHRKVVLMPYYTDFTAQDALNEICKQGVTYIYAAGTNQSFNKALLSNKPEWYARQLTLPGIQVYRLNGCP